MRPLILLLGFFLASTSGQAQPREYVIDTFDVRLELREDGSYEVRETVTFDFRQGTFTQGVRSIPGRRLDDVSNVTVRGVDAEVTEVVHERDGRDHLIVWTFPERTGPTTFVVRYEVTGALVADGERNAVTWNVVGDEVDVHIGQLRLQVVIPDFDLDSADIEAAPPGEASVERSATGWVASFSHSDLPAATPYQAIVSFPQRLGGRSPEAPPWYLFLGIGAFVLTLLPGVLAHSRRLPRVSARPELGAPDVSIPEAGLLLTDLSSFGARVFPGVMFDLAARGHLTLRQTSQKRWHGKEDRLEVEQHPRREDLSEFEQRFLDELAKHDSFQEFSSKAWTFGYEAARPVRQGLVERGLLRDQRARSNRLFMGAGAVLIAGLVVSLSLSGWPVAVGLGLTAGTFLGTLIVASARYLPSQAGAIVRAQAKAYTETVRRSIVKRLEDDPREAALLFLDRLPWLFLDPKVTSSWFDKFEKALKNAGADVQLPSWIRHATGADETNQMVMLLTTVSMVHSSSATSGSMTGVSAGVGAMGGAGGGGVGAR